MSCCSCSVSIGMHNSRYTAESNSSLEGPGLFGMLFLFLFFCPRLLDSLSSRLWNCCAAWTLVSLPFLTLYLLLSNAMQRLRHSLSRRWNAMELLLKQTHDETFFQKNIFRFLRRENKKKCPRKRESYLQLAHVCTFRYYYEYISWGQQGDGRSRRKNSSDKFFGRHNGRTDITKRKRTKCGWPFSFSIWTWNKTAVAR